jgi:hypothetical protein
MRARGSLLSHSFFANPSRRLTFPSHMLEPSSQDLLRGASILNHRCGAFSVEPPSWCLLRKALIQNKHQAFVCDLHSGPLSEAFVLGLRPRPSIQTFVWDLCPEPLSRTFERIKMPKRGGELGFSKN